DRDLTLSVRKTAICWEPHGLAATILEQFRSFRQGVEYILVYILAQAIQRHGPSPNASSTSASTCGWRSTRIIGRALLPINPRVHCQPRSGRGAASSIAQRTRSGRTEKPACASHERTPGGVRAIAACP